MADEVPADGAGRSIRRGGRHYWHAETLPEFPTGAVLNQQITAAAITPAVELDEPLAGLGGWGNGDRMQIDRSLHVVRAPAGTPARTIVTHSFAEQARRHGIVPELSFVLSSPPEPQADVAQTLGFVRRVKRVNPLAEITPYLYTPVPRAGYLYESSRRSRLPAARDHGVLT